LWARNSLGYSRPVRINATESWWLGPSVASSDEVVSLYGRNLKLGEIRGSHIYIENKGTNVAGQWATIVSSNPYRIDFEVPHGLKSGDYWVYAHNGHGQDYGWANRLLLTIRDPLVSGGGTKYDVTAIKYGASPDDTIDDYQAIADAIADANADA